MTFTLRAFRTRGVYINFPVFRKTIADRIATKVVPTITAAARRRVEGWVVPPDFATAVRLDAQGIHASVIPTGPGADNWIRVSRGVKGHWIQVRKTVTYRGKGNYKPALRLNRYQPSTAPGGTYGGASYRLPPTGYRRLVWWPGIRPRLFEEDIAKEVRGPYRREMESALRVAVKEAQKAGSPAVQ